MVSRRVGFSVVASLAALASAAPLGLSSPALIGYGSGDDEVDEIGMTVARAAGEWMASVAAPAGYDCAEPVSLPMFDGGTWIHVVCTLEEGMGDCRGLGVQLTTTSVSTGVLPGAAMVGCVGATGTVRGCAAELFFCTSFVDGLNIRFNEFVCITILPPPTNVHQVTCRLTR